MLLETLRRPLCVQQGDAGTSLWLPSFCLLFQMDVSRSWSAAGRRSQTSGVTALHEKAQVFGLGRRFLLLPLPLPLPSPQML